MIGAPSNRAARGVGGITLHVANKLIGFSSLMTANSRAKRNQKAAMQAYSRLGAKLLDELSQLNSKLFHADAYLTAFARPGIQNIIDVPNYANYNQTWG